MQRKQNIMLAIASTLFAVGAFAKAEPAYAEACSGSESVCSGSCVQGCNPKDPNDCWVVCSLTKKAEE